jgi:hypothetical protein
MAGLPAADPWSAGIMAAGSVATAALKPPGSSNSGGNNFTSDYDGSAWSVNVGSGSAAATNAKTDSPLQGAANGLMKSPLLLGLAVVALVLYLRT